MSNILQFKITLKNSKPTIWRRFLIEDKLTFHDLHLVIQNVMGWTNSHLYQFVYDKNSFIGIPDEDEMDDDNDITNAKELVLASFFDKPKISIKYEYDFGDGWDHELVLEKIQDKEPGTQYPSCIKGERNCPPEDCGGIWGFYNMLDILKDKKHPEYEEMLEWLGDGYDAEEFDIDTVNENLQDYKDIDLGFDW